MACLLLPGAWHGALDAGIVLGTDTPPPSALSDPHHQVGPLCPKPGPHPGALPPALGLRGAEQMHSAGLCACAPLGAENSQARWVGGGQSAGASFTTWVG